MDALLTYDEPAVFIGIDTEMPNSAFGQSSEDSQGTTDSLDITNSSVELALMPLSKSPALKEFQKIESTYQTALKASQQLALLHDSPWGSCTKSVESKAEMWAIAMQNFNYSIAISQRYADQMADFMSMSNADKIKLYVGCVYPITVAAFAMGPKPAFGANAAISAKFDEFFPEFEPVNQLMAQISTVFAAWKPSAAELAMLQALLFFQFDSLNRIEKPDAVLEGNRRISVSLAALVHQSHKPEEKMFFFNRAYDLLLKFKHQQIESITNFAYANPDLFHSDQMYVHISALIAGSCLNVDV